MAIPATAMFYVSPRFIWQVTPARVGHAGVKGCTEDTEQLE